MTIFRKSNDFRDLFVLNQLNERQKFGKWGRAQCYRCLHALPSCHDAVDGDAAFCKVTSVSNDALHSCEPSNNRKFVKSGPGIIA